MRKLILALILMVAIGFAADDYLITTGNLEDSSWTQKGENPYTVILFDTATISVTNPATDTVIDLGALYYNFQIRSLNGAGDSGSVKIAFSAHQSFWHDDSIARNMDWAAVGLNTADDYFYAPIGSRYIYTRPVVGGTADSSCILEIKAFR